jgi:hypothetical protein
MDTNRGEILDLVRSYVNNLEKYITSGTIASSRRARQALADIIPLARQERKRILEHRITHKGR